jgi:hypothetical protein
MPDFEDIYGKPADKMTEGEFRIAAIGLLDGICKRLDITNGKVKCVDAHKVYFRLIGGFTGGIVIPILVWLIIRSLA